MKILRVVDMLEWIVPLAWLTFLWAAARAPSFGPPLKYIQVFDAVLAIAWVTFSWRAYSHHQIMLRERAFQALAGPPPPARSTVIQRGSRGPAVLSWKERLREVGYVVPADDVFDAETEAATVAYQQSLGVAADGMVGARTYLRALRPLGWPRHFRHWWRR